MGESSEIREGDQVKRTGRIMSVPVGEAHDRARGERAGPAHRRQGADRHQRSSGPIEVIAPGVVERQPVREPLETGIKAIDSMVNIGRGQRELIIGDRQTGKTAIAIDTIINQKGKGVVCIYVAIGQKRSTVAQVVKTLEDFGAMEHTIVVVRHRLRARALPLHRPLRRLRHRRVLPRQRPARAVRLRRPHQARGRLSRDLAAAAPSAGTRGLSRATSSTCTAACWSARPSSRTRRAAGSLTAIPIIETQAGDISAYIPTNVISITDGQIFLESDLFNSGIRPAVNVGNSVSRVGGSAQVKAMKEVAGRLRLDLAQFRELAAFAMFAGDLDKATQGMLAKGERLTEILKQNQYEPLPMEKQVFIIFAATNGFLDALPGRGGPPLRAGALPVPGPAPRRRCSRTLAEKKDIKGEIGER